ncbi:response regulator (plasmid) [Pseudomonas putida]|uniref:response regulator transcription factor n=1 Tax=Pseudomonas putida TaxID=303 RepID=UPI001BAEA99B|nr:response regulator transcription factor [Pseudomonas putida]QUG92757.1 response regulator [Pseudomonas putida]
MKPASLKILLVHEHPALRSQIRICLKASGYEVVEADSCKQAVGLMHSCEVSAMIVDSDAPDFIAASPLSARNFTRNSNAPCIVLATSRIIQKPLEHFNAETDDYLFKPFNVIALEKHVKAVLNSHCNDSKLTFGSITICSARNTMTIDRTTTKLPYKQMRLLFTLVRNAPRAVQKEHFAESFYLPDMKVRQPLKSVESLVFRLRNRLRTASCDVRIKSVRGIGYRISTTQSKTSK